jgi:hypothetical protein
VSAFSAIRRWLKQVNRGNPVSLVEAETAEAEAQVEGRQRRPGQTGGRGGAGGRRGDGGAAVKPVSRANLVGR